MGYTSKRTRSAPAKGLRSGHTKATRQVSSMFMNLAKKDKKRKK
jgi:hypothetical protein